MRKMLAVLVLALITVLTGCSVGGSPESLPKVTTGDKADSLAVIETLNNAKNIQLRKTVISFGDEWTVVADGREVAKIKGQPLYMIGDTYSMFTLKGNLVGSEGEQFRIINHRADLYDYNNTKIGSIDQEVLSFLYKFTFRDAAGNVTGKMDQDFNLVLAGTMMDANGTPAWKFSKQFLSWGATLDLTRQSSDTRIDVMSAIWMTVIINEIDESRQSKPKNN